MKRIHKIITSNLCLGCGLCEAIAGRDKCEMFISSDGFYRPHFKTELNNNEIKEILEICPGIHIEGDNHFGVWGNILAVTESWANDNVIRKKSASGGVISALAIYLLESKKVDAILQVGVKKDSWLYNELLVSRTKEDIISNAQSRYAPALIFNNIKTFLNSSNEIYCFIGKPCDIAGMKNFIKISPQFEGRIKYTLAIFCAGIPNYNATKTLISQANISGNPNFVKYRGDGWPGEFEVRWETGQSFKISYNDSWGKILGRALCMRCKICPDGIGMLADISTGDSWNTKDGFPDFKEADGINFCFIRTQNGCKLYQGAVKSGYISTREFKVTSLKNIHRYQYLRRILAPWRITAIQILTLGLLKFKGLGLYRLFFKVNFITGVKEFLGTIRRIYNS